MLYYELLKPGETVTGKYYSLQLNHLAEKIQEKRPYTGRGHRPVILQHNNAKPHRSSVVYQTIKKLRWEVLPHPAYSPDTAPCDYHLFRYLQNSLAEQQFQNEVEVRKIVDNFISSTDHAFFQCRTHQLPERWQRVVEVNGAYTNQDFLYLIFVNKKNATKKVELFCTPNSSRNQIHKINIIIFVSSFVDELFILFFICKFTLPNLRNTIHCDQSIEIFIPISTLEVAHTNNKNTVRKEQFTMKLSMTFA